MVLCGNEKELAAFTLEHAQGTKILPLGGDRYSVVAAAQWRSLCHELPRGSVLFFPHWDAPPLSLPFPRVVTIHDLIHLRVPGSASAVNRAGMKWWLRRVIAASKKIICVSEYTRRDVEEFAPSAHDRIRVVPNGVSERFRGSPLPPRTPDRGPYLLCVAVNKLHKNLGVAVEVLARMDDQALTLILAGEGGPYKTQVMARAEQLGVAERVISIDPVQDGELRALYHGAEALLFPSRYEGFGLPVLEAMACGTPVVGSNAAAIPEIAGDAAMLFDPDDARGMAEAVRRLRIDPQLRAEYVAKGRARAAEFSWDRSAELTEAVLLEAAQ